MYFNSIKVRLKLFALVTVDTTYYYFNSIKVRLKLFINYKFYYLVQFQFHKGTIKTQFCEMCRDLWT